MRAIFALLVITAVCGCAKSPTSERIAQAQSAIAATLKDPSSAQFKDIREARPGVFCGAVNATNSSGTYRGFERFVYVQPFAVKLGDEKDVGPHIAGDATNLPPGGIIPGDFHLVDYGMKYGC